MINIHRVGLFLGFFGGVMVGSTLSAESRMEKEELIIYSLNEEGVTQPIEKTKGKDGFYGDATGAYIDMLKALLGDKYKLKFVYTTWARTEKMFIKGKAQSLLGQNPLMLEGKMKKGSYISPKCSLDRPPLVAFYLKAKYKNWNDDILKKAKVLWMRGYRMDLLIKQRFQDNSLKISFSEFDDYKSGLERVVKGRADVLLDYEGTPDPFMDKKDKDLFGQTFTKVTDNITLVFQNNPTNQKIVQHWNKVYRGLEKNGKFDKIFKKYEYTYVPCPAD